jgi:putative flippase GtrA
VTSAAQIGRFIAVGLLTALVYYGLLVLAVELLQLGPVIASGLCYVLVVVLNYLLHYHWTFTASAGHSVVVNRYILMLCGGFILNTGAMYSGVSIMGWNYLLVQTAAIGLIACWNYVLSAQWVFRD